MNSNSRSNWVWMRDTTCGGLHPVMAHEVESYIAAYHDIHLTDEESLAEQAEKDKVITWGCPQGYVGCTQYHIPTVEETAILCADCRRRIDDGGY
jgi:hypothetical protein